MIFAYVGFWVNINYIILFGDTQKGCIVKYQLPENPLQTFETSTKCNEYFKKNIKNLSNYDRDNN